MFYTEKWNLYHIENMTGDVECSNETKCEINNFSNNTLTTMAFIKIWLMVMIFWDHFESYLRWYIFCNWSTWTVIILFLWCSYFNIIRLRILETTFWRSIVFYLLTQFMFTIAFNNLLSERRKSLKEFKEFK